MNKLHEKILSIYMKISEVCGKEKIPHYVIGGACLGAVRNQGFIPWDDDMDIAIPIEFWGRLRSKLEDNLPEYYGVRSWNDVITHSPLLLKVYDKRTTYIEHHELLHEESYKGIFVDIKPISGVPTNKIMKWIFINKIQMYRKLNQYLRYPYNRNDRILGKVLWIMLLPIRNKIRYDYFSNKGFRELQRYPVKYSNVVGFVWCSNAKKVIMPVDWFIKEVFVEFEDIKVPCPENYKGYLNKYFKDYTRLPPMEERIPSHPGLVDIYRSYDEYKNNKELLKDYPYFQHLYHESINQTAPKI